MKRELWCVCLQYSNADERYRVFENQREAREFAVSHKAICKVFIWDMYGSTAQAI